MEENETGQDRSDKITLNYNDGAATLEITVNQTTSDGIISSLDEKGTANCYIVSEAGYYQFKAVKGNSEETVGTISTAEVLWESFCTDVAPNKGDLISEVYAGNGKVFFKTGDPSKSGNAVIAVKDASGNILWSWHIWMPEELPIDQLYKNGAGIMMDRNLGATKNIKRDSRSYGLLYQWGRKDPFLAPSTLYYVSPPIKAASTITWPAPMGCNENTGTIEYTIANPTTFIKSTEANNYDWLYNTGSAIFTKRWSRVKSIYDPCPPGYRVASGGSDGVWAKALGFNEGEIIFYYKDGGRDFGSWMCSDTSSFCWYPVTGVYIGTGDLIDQLGEDGTVNPPKEIDRFSVWSCDFNSSENKAYEFLSLSECYSDSKFNLFPVNSSYVVYGQPVRCQKIK